MDPNIALAKIRAAVDTGQYEDVTIYFIILDDWLSAGESLPDDWAKDKVKS